jgi:putative Mg2+ transporter-C (MgtC) family protein
MEYINIVQSYFPEHSLSISLSMFLGLLFGVERAFKHKVASIKTFPTVALSACLFSILSYEFGTDKTRIAAQIVSGIGFASAGIIFKSENRVEGVTTAVLVWLAAGIGMASGFKEYGLAITVAISYLIFSRISSIIHHLIDKVDQKNTTKNK